MQIETSAKVGALAGLLLATVLIPTAAPGQGGGKAGAAADAGRQLYEVNCVACHQAGGGGAPPAMPALAGNANLADTGLVVRTIRSGRGGMPAFAQLSTAEIAAVTSYIRSAWGNTFGAVTVQQVETALAASQPPAESKISIWSGVYTKAQSERGADFYEGACSHCHGSRLDGAGAPDQPPSPAIARASFLRKWSGRSVAALFTYVRTKMPPDNPGTYGAQENIDAIAHMLAVSNIPAGDKELPADPKLLEGIVIEDQRK